MSQIFVLFRQSNRRSEDSDLDDMGGLDTTEWVTFLHGETMANALEESVLDKHDGKVALSCAMTNHFAVIR